MVERVWSLAGELSLSMRMTASWTDDHFVGQTSAIGQPIRPTQPFILTGSINE